MTLALDRNVLAELVAAVDLDLSQGLQVLPLDAIARRPFDPGMALLILPPTVAESVSSAADDGADFDPPVLPGRHGHGTEPVTLLRRLYPADHPVMTLDRAG